MTFDVVVLISNRKTFKQNQSLVVNIEDLQHSIICNYGSIIKKSSYV